MSAASQDHSERDPSILTLERIFSDKEFETKGYGPVRWLEDDSGYLVLETADSKTDEKAKQQQFVHHDLRTKERQVLAVAEQFYPRRG